MIRVSRLPAKPIIIYSIGFAITKAQSLSAATWQLETDTKFFYHNHYLPYKYNANISAMCAIVTIMIAQTHVAVDMRTLSDRNNLSSRTNGQVAARRVTGFIIKRLCYH